MKYLLSISARIGIFFFGSYLLLFNIIMLVVPEVFSEILRHPETYPIQYVIFSVTVVSGVGFGFVFLVGFGQWMVGKNAGNVIWSALVLSAALHYIFMFYGRDENLQVVDVLTMLAVGLSFSIAIGCLMFAFDRRLNFAQPAR